MPPPLGYEGPAGAARVLIVDDEDVIQRVLHALLSDDYALASVESGEQALEFLSRAPADVVLVDKNLPRMSGLELLRRIKQNTPGTEVIVITGYASLQSAIESLRLGAYDYLLKPFDDIAVVAEKVTRAAEKKGLQQERNQLFNQLMATNQELREAHDQLRRGYLETLTSMITALEARDAYTRGHSDRVADVAVAIGRELGLSTEKLSHLRDAARLHDLGKLGVREDILNKAGRLTAEEFVHIKRHPLIGSDILGKMEAYRHLLPMIRHHHERWDGEGYPDGLAGEQIPLEARIIAVADAFDAITSKRPYRAPLSEEQAIEIIREQSGSQLDATVVGAFLMAVRRGPILALAGT